MSWDVFISHASDDKDAFVRPLAERLSQLGIRVWYDEFTLSVGDSLRRSIDRGLANSRTAIVVLSPAFLNKAWPARELDGLIAREISAGVLLLPVWHRVTHDDVLAYSPPLADRVAARSDAGIDHVAKSLADSIRRSSTQERAVTTFKTTTEVDFFSGRVAVSEAAIALLEDTLGSRSPELTIIGAEPTFEDPYDESYWNGISRIDAGAIPVARYVNLWSVAAYGTRSMFVQAAYSVWIRRLSASINGNPNCRVFHTPRAPLDGTRCVIANTGACLDAGGGHTRPCCFVDRLSSQC